MLPGAGTAALDGGGVIGWLGVAAAVAVAGAGGMRMACMAMLLLGFETLSNVSCDAGGSAAALDKVGASAGRPAAVAATVAAAAVAAEAVVAAAAAAAALGAVRPAILRG